MLKATEVEEGLDLILYRPLAFGLVKAVQPTPITPNQITFASLIMGLASGYCYWQGTPQYLLWGAILLFLTNLFDCADGMLARNISMLPSWAAASADIGPLSPM